MTMRGAARPAPDRSSLARVLPASLLALAAGLALGSCGSSGKGLIPGAQAGPLLGDFEAVQHAAENGGGNCAATNAALAKTEEDFAALPTSVDNGLRTSLHQGIANLSNKARELCSQPAVSTTRTTTSPKTNTSTTPPAKTTPTTTTPTTTTPTTSTETTTTPPPGGARPGGAQAPGEEPSQGGEAGGGAAREEKGTGGAGAQEGTK